VKLRGSIHISLITVAPFIYSITSLCTLGIYIRKKYTIPDLSRCDGCPLRLFCDKVSIPPFLRPRRFARPVPRRRYYELVALVCTGYALLSMLALLQNFDEGILGVYLGTGSALLALLPPYKVWQNAWQNTVRAT